MGIGRPSDPHGMTEPPAWPDVDEDVLKRAAMHSIAPRKLVGAQLDAAELERIQMFSGVGSLVRWCGERRWQSARQRGSQTSNRFRRISRPQPSFSTIPPGPSTDAKNQIISNVEIGNREFRTDTRSRRNTGDKGRGDPAGVESYTDGRMRSSYRRLGISGKPPDAAETAESLSRDDTWTCSTQRGGERPPVTQGTADLRAPPSVFPEGGAYPTIH